MTKLLAFDTSMSSTGYALFVDCKISEYGSIDISPKLKGEDSVREMIKGIYEKIDEYDPQIIVVEQTSVGRNVAVQRNLTMILGAIFTKCFINDIYYHPFRASEWRKLADPEKKPIKRAELKQWSIDKVNSFLKTEINNDNISDAILIGMAYINMFNALEDDQL